MVCGKFVILIVFFSFLTASFGFTCNSADYRVAKMAFQSVVGFDPTTSLKCLSPMREISLPSRGLRGTISWSSIAKLTYLQSLDLSNNSIQGSIPGGFWSTTRLLHLNLSNNQLGGRIGFHPSDPRRLVPGIETLNLSNNRFSVVVSLTQFRNLKVFDVSDNRLTNNSVLVNAFDLGVLSFVSVSGNPFGSLPNQLNNSSRVAHLDLSRCNLSGSVKPISFLPSLTYLDVSENRFTGSFPRDFPPLHKLSFLNISFNRFSGVLEFETAKRFGNSAFIRSGLTSPGPKVPDPVLVPNGTENSLDQKRRIGIITGAASAAAFILVVGVLLLLCLCRSKKRSKWVPAMKPPPSLPVKIHEAGPFSFETDSHTWVVDIKEPTSARVVMFEKPLTSLTFADLMVATSRFSRESQLAESRSGPVYRAVLSGEMHVAIKVLERAKNTGTEEAVATLEALGRIKHPNLLPLLGYCIAGKEKLLLYEFMANGNLHQWLHELPTGETNVEDWSMDVWEQQMGEEDQYVLPEETGWITRHRIAIGIARGLAFLHHAGSKPIVHGRFNPFNILLDDSLEPRISDFGLGEIIAQGSYRHSAYSAPGSDPTRLESDVYSFGVVLLELVTGRVGSEKLVSWVRNLVRERHGVKAIDPRLKQSGSISGMVESLRVGYLCTAESEEKRPTMQQVVGLLKDIKPA